MKKTIKTMVVIVTMLLISTISLANNNTDVLINNKPVNFNRLHNNQPVGQPYINNGRTYLPIRVISEDLGYEVDWKQESQTAVIQKGKNKVEITIGQSVALVNGVKKPIDVQNGVVQDTKAVIKNSRTYVPVRFISEAMEDKVEYRMPSNSDVKVLTVYINCTNLPVEKPVEPKPTPPVVKPNPSGLVPEFHITPHTKAGAMDYKIWLKNFKKYEGTGLKVSPALVSHPQYNSFKVKDPFTGEWHIENNENKFMSNQVPNYNLSTFNLVSWERDGDPVKGYLDIKTGKPQLPPKVGEVMKWQITLDMKSGAEVYEVEIPYRNFTESIVTSGTRIK